MSLTAMPGKVLVLRAEDAPQDGTPGRGPHQRYRAPRLGVETRAVAPPGPGRLQVEMLYAGVCGTDLHLLQTDPLTRLRAHVRAGHDPARRARDRSRGRGPRDRRRRRRSPPAPGQHRGLRLDHRLPALPGVPARRLQPVPRRAAPRHAGGRPVRHRRGRAGLACPRRDGTHRQRPGPARRRLPGTRRLRPARLRERARRGRRARARLRRRPHRPVRRHAVPAGVRGEPRHAGRAARAPARACRALVRCGLRHRGIFRRRAARRST